MDSESNSGVAKARIRIWIYGFLLLISLLHPSLCDEENSSAQSLSQILSKIRQAQDTQNLDAAEELLAIGVKKYPDSEAIKYYRQVQTTSREAERMRKERVVVNNGKGILGFSPSILAKPRKLELQPQPRTDLSLKFSTDKEEYKLGEPVVLKGSLHSMSAREITIPGSFGSNPTPLTLGVFTSEGTFLGDAFFFTDGSLFDHTEHIAPGEERPFERHCVAGRIPGSPHGGGPKTWLQGGDYWIQLYLNLSSATGVSTNSNASENILVSEPKKIRFK